MAVFRNEADAAADRRDRAPPRLTSLPPTIRRPGSKPSAPKIARTSSDRLEPIRPVTQNISPAQTSKVMSSKIPFLLKFSQASRTSPVPRGGAF